MAVFNKKTFSEPTAYDIYYEMLDIGSKHIKDGISLPEIKEHLYNLNLIKEEELGDYIDTWFTWSFEHKELTCNCKRRPGNECGCNNDDPCNEYNHTLNCKYFLSKTACIDLLHLKESKNNAKSSYLATRNGHIALIIALASLISPIVFDKCYNSKEDSLLQSISQNTNTEIEELKAYINLQQSAANQQTILSYNLNNKIDSILLVLEKERENLKKVKPKQQSH